jgi:hypothetical protein
MEIAPTPPIGGQKFHGHFEKYMQYFEVLKNICLFTPLFDVESLKMFRGTLLGKHWYNDSYTFRLNALLSHYQALLKILNEIHIKNNILNFIFFIVGFRRLRKTPIFLENRTKSKLFHSRELVSLFCF